MQQDMLDLIRATFRKSGMSIKQLADRSGVPYSVTHGVVKGTRDPVLHTVTRLCATLDLELRPIRRPKRKGG